MWHDFVNTFSSCHETATFIIQWVSVPSFPVHCDWRQRECPGCCGAAQHARISLVQPCGREEGKANPVGFFTSCSSCVEHDECEQRSWRERVWESDIHRLLGGQDGSKAEADWGGLDSTARERSLRRRRGLWDSCWDVSDVKCSLNCPGKRTMEHNF